LTTIPIDYPTYNYTSQPTIPSLDAFNNDIEILLHQPMRKSKRTSHHHIVSNPKRARALPYTVETAQISYSLARFENDFDCWSDAVTPAFRFTRDEGLDVHIERMMSVIKGFEKAFWQI
jgi:hypothetical protein